MQEDKAKVERLRWVFDSLVPALTGQPTDKLSPADVKRRALAATAILRLALDETQAQRLLAGLEQSPDEEVKKVVSQARKDIVEIDRSEVLMLVEQSVGNDVDARRAALGRLRQAYPNSPTAISRAIERLRDVDGNALSNTGLVNLLYFLARTDPAAWTPELRGAAGDVLPKIRRSGRAGNQWKRELEDVEAVLNRPAKT